MKLTVLLQVVLQLLQPFKQNCQKESKSSFYQEMISGNMEEEVTESGIGMATFLCGLHFILKDAKFEKNSRIDVLPVHAIPSSELKNLNVFTDGTIMFLLIRRGHCDAPKYVLVEMDSCWPHWKVSKSEVQSKGKELLETLKIHVTGRNILFWKGPLAFDGSESLRKTALLTGILAILSWMIKTGEFSVACFREWLEDNKHRNISLDEQHWTHYIYNKEQSHAMPSRS